VLDLLVCAFDQARRTILQIRQARFLNRLDIESSGVFALKQRIGFAACQTLRNCRLKRCTTRLRLPPRPMSAVSQALLELRCDPVLA